MISIIIPTRNEEEHLPKLLNSIKKQRFKVHEIIVADADSTDNTAKIAKSYGCKIVPGGDHPGEGRNIGAKHAKSDMLLFLDGDGLLPENFLRESHDFLSKKNVEVAVVGLSPDSNRVLDKIILGVSNSHQKVMQYFWPLGVGACIFCSKSLFDKIGGFDQTVILAEDMEFVKRAAKYGKFRVIPKQKVTYSMRRFRDDGYLNMILWCIQAEFYRMFRGEIRHNRNKYVPRKEFLARKQKTR